MPSPKDGKQKSRQAAQFVQKDQGGQHEADSRGHQILREAIQVCQSPLDDDRKELGESTEISSQRDRQITLLSDWATEKGLWISQKLPAELKDAGTREHLLFDLEEEPDRIFKITKCPGFGIQPAIRSGAIKRGADIRYWFEDRDATPLEYLQRLLLIDQDLTKHLSRTQYPIINRLEGFVRSRGNLQIVTSQPIFVGEPATVLEIKAWFESQGFQYVKAWTWFRANDGLVVFDALGDNVMKCDGIMVPFDTIPLIATGNMADALHAAMSRLADQVAKRTARK